MSIVSSAVALQSRVAGFCLRVVAVQKRWCAAFIAWRIQQAAITHLNSLSDRELEDIGLCRADIKSAVVGGCARDPRCRHYY